MLIHRKKLSFKFQKIVHNLDTENEIVQSFIDKKTSLEFDFSTTEMDSKNLKTQKNQIKKLLTSMF